jgi:hypothetical protein
VVSVHSRLLVRGGYFGSSVRYIYLFLTLISTLDRAWFDCREISDGSRTIRPVTSRVRLQPIRQSVGEPADGEDFGQLMLLFTVAFRYS